MNRLALEIVGGVAAVVLFALLLGSQQAVGRLNDQLAACGKANKELASEIKSKAVEEGKRYEALEAQHLADCRAAYDAGAGRLRDDEAVRAGLYVPRQRPGKANGPAAGAGHGR